MRSQSNQRSGRRSDAGFTLLELLMVISIISVLAAFAVPRYVESQRGAQQQRAIQAIRQIFQAQQVFHQKNGFYANSIAELVNSKSLVGTWSGTDLDMQAISYWEFSTRIPLPSTASIPASPEANRRSRFRVGAQPVGTTTQDRLKRGDMMYMMLEDGRLFEHRYIGGCSLSHMDSTLQVSHDLEFGSTYPAANTQ